MQYDPDLSLRSTIDGTPLNIAANDEIKCILNGLDSQSIPKKKKREKKLQPKNDQVTEVPGSVQNNNQIYQTQRGIDQHLLQVQQHYLLKYNNQAYENGTPTNLPIFCKACAQPFTYPIGVIEITCPLCLTQNEIK